MSAWQAVFLGIVQGLTEFLPVSSSGHLVLAGALLGIPSDGIAFEIFVHLGTLLAVITVFWRDLVALGKALGLRLVRGAHPAEAEESNPGDPLHLVAFLILATVPGAVVGYLGEGFFESTFGSPRFASAALLVTGTILMVSRRARASGEPLTAVKALLIGLAQVIAFFPGVSRSGTTIVAGLFLDLAPVEAARFSFLMAIPLILGVAGMKLLEMVRVPPSNAELTTLILGAAAAYVSGLMAIRWLLNVLQKGRFARFAYYCFAAGGLGLLLSFLAT